MPSTGPSTTIADDGATRVGRLLYGWGSREETTLPERLAMALIELIDQGELEAGFRIPSERRLAETLAVSRGTVTSAYARLRSDGWLDSRVGSGSRVLSVKGKPSVDHMQISGRLSTLHQRSGLLDLTTGALAGLEMTMDLARVAVEERLPALLGDEGYAPQGMLELRGEVARYYRDLGAPTTSAEVAITTGAQQALHLLTDAFVAPGDTVLVEDPTFRGAIEVLRNRGAKVASVPVGVDGPDLEVLERMVARLRPRIVYLLPTAHNPTGYVATPTKAAAIAEIVASSDAMFVEDGSPADLLLDRPKPPTPIGVRIPADRWVAIGSISKLFWGGLRVGWIRGSESAIQRITRIKTVADLGTSLVSQLIAVECLRVVDEARRARRAQLQSSLEQAGALLRELAPEWSWEKPQGGSALWVRVPDTDTRALAELGRRCGVSIVPGSFFSPIEGCDDYIRIPFWGDRDELRAGLERLRGAWDQMQAE
jgi:DNA-binding transcriptional MocR family regulator